MSISSAEVPYSYFSNGLYIVSEIAFPELPVVKGNLPDSCIPVNFKLGIVPEELDSIIAKGPLFQVSDSEFLLDVKHIGRYLIKNKKDVTIQPVLGASDSDVRLYALATIIGVLLHMNNILALHASCLKLPGVNEAILIAGPSGAGKSTLALGLYRKGYEVLNDDVSSVYFNNGVPYVHPGFIRLKLWEESLNAYGYEIDGLYKIRNEINKFSFPVCRSGNTVHGVKLKGIIFISSESIKEPELKRVENMNALIYLRSNTFRYKFVKSLQQTDSHFQACSKVAGAVSMIKVSRPQKIDPNLFASYVEDVIAML